LQLCGGGGGLSMCFGVCVRVNGRRRAAVTTTTTTTKKTKQTVRSFQTSTSTRRRRRAGGRANAFNEHQERMRVAVPPVQGRRWDTALNNLTGLLLRARSRDHQPASVCVREPYLTESRTFRLLVGTAKSRQEFCTFRRSACQLPCASCRQVKC